MRRFVVLGLGTFGMALIRELVSLGGRVTALDRDPERAREALSHGAEALVGEATDPEALRKVVGKGADVGVVSLGTRREDALLAVLQLTRLELKEIVAKADDADQAEILRRVGAGQVLLPEHDMALRLAKRLGSGNVLDYLSLGRDFSVIELAPGPDLIGKTLAELSLSSRYGVQVLAIKELVPEKVVLAPGAEQRIKDSDVLVVGGTERAVRRLRNG